MSNLYGRKIEVIAGSKSFNNDDFHILFDVPFDDGPEPNIAEIKIYNLKTQTITELKKGTKVTLNAGYQKDVGAIFLGEIQIPQTKWNGVDRITQMDCMDSGEAWFKKEINRTYKAGMTGQQVLNDLLSQTGLKAAVIKLGFRKVYQNGKTVKGKLIDGIMEVAKDCGAKVHVNRGKIFIRPKNDGDNIRFVLDSATGLVGSPTPVEKEERYDVIEKGKRVQKTRTRRGWKIISLLNHRITTDSLIQVKSKTANGTFRVESGKHICGGSSFYTETEVYPL